MTQTIGGANRQFTQRRMKKQAGIKKAIVISDLHCGGTTAIMPPGFETLEGQKIGQNILQQWLWPMYQEFVRESIAEAGDGFALFINGDCIDGNHHHTTQIISPDSNDHVKCFLETIEPLASRAAKIFISEGTETHTRNAEYAIAKILKAVPDPVRGKACWDRINVNINGFRVVLHHHMPATSREWLRSNALAQMLANEQLAAARSGETIPDVLGMAHRHTADMIQAKYGIAFTTPSWQLATRFTGKVVPHASVDRIEVGGGVIDCSGETPRYIAITKKAKTCEPLKI